MRVILIILCFAVFVLPAQANVKRISLDEAVGLSISYNIDLQAKRKEIEVLKQEVKMANALKNPQIQSNVLMGSVGKSNASQAGLAIPVEIAKRGVRKKAAIANMRLLENQIRKL